MTKMTHLTMLLVTEILEDSIHNKHVSPDCKAKIMEALNPAELKSFATAMVMQMDSDERIKIVRFRERKD